MKSSNLLRGSKHSICSIFKPMVSVPARVPACRGDKLRRESRVLDRQYRYKTWIPASAGMTMQSTLTDPSSAPLKYRCAFVY
jgi:hypothetical protein